LKSKQLAVTNFNIEIDNTKLFRKEKEFIELLPPKSELKTGSGDIPEHETEEKKAEDLKTYFEEKDNELKNIISTIPENVTFTQIPLESFELEVDLVNHVTESGGIDKFNFEMYDKPTKNAKENFELKVEQDNNLDKLEELQKDIDTIK
jgi:hypothetical protein